MKTVAEVISVSRSNLADRLQERCNKRIARPPLSSSQLTEARDRVRSFGGYNS